jgi:hypothetical protein
LPCELPEFAAVKIVVKLEKAGQVIAQSELEIDNPKYLKRRTGKAFMQFYKDLPDQSLFEEGVCLKFEKTPGRSRRRSTALRRRFESWSHR